MTTTQSSSRPDAVLDGLARELRQAEKDRLAIPPLTAQLPLTSEEGYRIQAVNTALRQTAGERIVGRKVGLTSAAMQAQLGVGEPDFGVLFDSMVIDDGGTLRLDELVAPRVEAEIAFRLGTDLAGTDVTAATAGAAVSEVFLALEIIDSRIADWKITLPDTIADNASSARIVTGPPSPASPRLLAALAELDVTLTRDGEPAAHGPGSAVLGDPLAAVVWLAHRLAGFGEGLRAGDIILAGAVHASVDLTPGTVMAASAAGFGPARLHVQ